MKNKIAILSALTLLSGSMTSNAASFIISNVVGGAGDTLYADKDNNLMNSGIVTVGYFSAAIDVTDIDTISELVAQLGNFTVVTSLAPGSPSTSLSGSFAGYAEQDDYTSAGSVTVGNALLGRSIYSIITDASSLASATATSQFALVLIGTFADDNPVEVQYSANPVNAPIIGSIGSYTGNASGLGDVTDGYITLKMDGVPEPTTTLLGAFGALGLLRRRRN